MKDHILKVSFCLAGQAIWDYHRTIAHSEAIFLDVLPINPRNSGATVKILSARLLGQIQVAQLPHCPVERRIKGEASAVHKAEQAAGMEGTGRGQAMRTGEQNGRAEWAGAEGGCMGLGIETLLYCFPP